MYKLSIPRTQEFVVSFTLHDPSTGDEREARLEGHINGSFGLYVEGYGDHGTEAGHGQPLFVEYRDKKLTAFLWADINQEDPTHIIDLNGALEHLLVPRGQYVLARDLVATDIWGLLWKQHMSAPHALAARKGTKLTLLSPIQSTTDILILLLDEKTYTLNVPSEWIKILE